MNEKEAKDVLNYFFEAGQMRFVRNSGWWVAKVRDPISIAEHSHRSAVIAYVLAKLEGSENPARVAVKALFHDMHETRLLDRHKIASKYLKTPKDVERKAEADQCELLGKEVGGELLELLGSEEDKTIFKDADYLEMAVTAREYYDVGYKDAWDWIERVSQVLKTKTAKQLCELLKKTDSGDWWKGLKEDVAKIKY
ncbi:HD domain-containing protein [Candidatus Micrarchaeota archaeon]|nr:HD domain-containing protein [Candidatus Micrarchaeota archaeon]